MFDGFIIDVRAELHDVVLQVDDGRCKRQAIDGWQREARCQSSIGLWNYDQIEQDGNGTVDERQVQIADGGLDQTHVDAGGGADLQADRGALGRLEAVDRHCGIHDGFDGKGTLWCLAGRKNQHIHKEAGIKGGGASGHVDRGCIGHGQHDFHVHVGVGRLEGGQQQSPHVRVQGKGETLGQVGVVHDQTEQVGLEILKHTRVDGELVHVNVQHTTRGLEPQGRMGQRRFGCTVG